MMAGLEEHAMRLLAAIDLTADGHDWLADRGAELATRLGATLDLLHVPDGGTSEDERASQGAALTALLAAAPVTLRGAVHVLPGAVLDEIVEHASDYDILVVGPRDPGGLEVLLQGTIAARVVRRVDCPVWIPRSDRRPTGSWRMLLGVDVRAENRAAIVSLAAPWVARLGGTLDLVYAVADGSDWQSAEIRDALEELRGRLPPEVRGAGFMRQGEPDEVLVELSGSYDLVLVGNRDRTGINRYLLGTVASTVVRRSRCDVLTIPTASLA